jgi:hypothetical protein
MTACGIRSERLLDSVFSAPRTAPAFVACRLRRTRSTPSSPTSSHESAASSPGRSPSETAVVTQARHSGGRSEESSAATWPGVIEPDRRVSAPPGILASRAGLRPARLSRSACSIAARSRYNSSRTVDAEALGLASPSTPEPWGVADAWSDLLHNLEPSPDTDVRAWTLHRMGEADQPPPPPRPDLPDVTVLRATLGI